MVTEVIWVKKVSLYATRHIKWNRCYLTVIWFFSNSLGVGRLGRAFGFCRRNPLDRHLQSTSFPFLSQLLAFYTMSVVYVASVRPLLGQVARISLASMQLLTNMWEIEFRSPFWCLIVRKDAHGGSAAVFGQRLDCRGERGATRSSCKCNQDEHDDNVFSTAMGSSLLTGKKMCSCFHPILIFCLSVDSSL